MALIGIIVLMILAIVVGKRSSALGLPQYIIIVLIALAQVCVVLYDVFTQKPPIP
jgi:hypothetical protein